jgi:hypothetical protein
MTQYQTLKGQRINGSLRRSYHTNILLKLSINLLDLELMHINKPVGLEYDVMYKHPKWNTGSSIKLENTEGVIKIGQSRETGKIGYTRRRQSRETGKIGYTRRRQTKQKHNTCLFNSTIRKQTHIK